MLNPLLSGTKADLLSLLMKEELSILQLAERLGMSGAAVRQHLQPLEAMGLVAHRKVITQPSRPSHLYRLTEAGKALFPRRHDLLLTEMIEVLLERGGQDALLDIVQEAARRLARPQRERLAGADPQTRWADALQWLEAQLAWHADAREEPDGTRRIVIHQCPFREASQAHPEICGTFFSTLIAQLYEDMPLAHESCADSPACCALVSRPAEA